MIDLSKIKDPVITVVDAEGIVHTGMVLDKYANLQTQVPHMLSMVVLHPKGLNTVAGDITSQK